MNYRIPLYLLSFISIFLALVVGFLMIDNYVFRVDQRIKADRIQELKNEIRMYKSMGEGISGLLDGKSVQLNKWEAQDE